MGEGVPEERTMKRVRKAEMILCRWLAWCGEGC